MLLYDRVGQATSIGRNLDAPGRPKGHGRDCLDAAHDLREVITHVGETRLGISRREIDNLEIILVASSMSCAIARLYATEYPRTVTALLLLDSTLANSDTVCVFPDPESAEFCPANLPLESLVSSV
jgi:pimeloyl-ACP methyl ester carboxylesterase